RKSLAAPVLAAVLFALFSCATPGTVQAQGTLEEAKRLYTEVIRLYRAGRYAEAVPLAERSLAILEKTVGPDHPNIVKTLNTLAGLYEKLEEAARLSARAKAMEGRLATRW
ncbi:MAG: tetratricopeptide repeat protein, partial [Nitrospinota bacterium]